MPTLATAADYAAPAKSNPFRPPDWRWKAAADYAATPGDPAVRRSADAWVLKAARLQADLQADKSPHARSARLGLWGPVGVAYRVYAGVKVARDLLGAELEGYLLAGLDDAAAAAEAGLPPAAVAAYAALFFDVRTRLDAAGWVAAAVVGPLMSGNYEDLGPAMVRGYGYALRDPGVVRGLARAVAVTRGAAPAGLYDALLEDTKVALAFKASLVARAVEPTTKTFRSIMEMQLKHLDQDRQTAPAKGDAGKYQDALAALVGGVRYGYAESPDHTPPGPETIVVGGETLT